MTNAETRHRHANSPSSPRQRHETPRYSLPRTSMFRRLHFSSAGLESANAAHERYSYRAMNTNDAGSPQMSGAYHIDSRSSTHLQSPRINARQPTRSKPYNTNHCEEEGPTWPFASTQAVHNSGVVRARTIYAKKKTDSIMRYTKLQKIFATTCDVHKPP